MYKKIRNIVLKKKHMSHENFTLIRKDGSKHEFVHRHKNIWDKLKEVWQSLRGGTK